MAPTGNKTPFIRPVRLEDAAEVAELSGQLGYPVSASEMSARLSRALADPDYVVTVAEGSDGSLLGWIGAEYRFLLEIGDEVEIVGLVVRQGTRRLGVGKVLLAAAEKFARTRGLDSIRVRSNVARVGIASILRTNGLRLGQDPALLPQAAGDAGRSRLTRRLEGGARSPVTQASRLLGRAGFQPAAWKRQARRLPDGQPRRLSYGGCVGLRPNDWRGQRSNCASRRENRPVGPESRRQTS